VKFDKRNFLLPPLTFSLPGQRGGKGGRGGKKGLPLKRGKAQFFSREREGREKGGKGKRTG